MTLLIRAAREADATLIFALVCELAEYENLLGEEIGRASCRERV